jgi:hypothetical protein
MFFRFFLRLHFQCYPKSPPYPCTHSPTHPFPYPPTPTWSWHSPVLRHMKFARPGDSPSNDGRLGHLLIHLQLETRALGVLVSSYWCSTYKVADHFSSLGTFSTYSIGDTVFHPINDLSIQFCICQALA